MTTEYIVVAVATVSLVISASTLAYVHLLRRRLHLIMSALDSRALRRYLRASEVRQKGRDRKRFIVFRLLSGKGMGKDELEHVMRESFKHLFGSVALAIAGLSLAHYDKVKGVGVARVRATHKNHAVLALAAVDVITDGEVIIQPLRTTGTLRKAIKYAESV